MPSKMLSLEIFFQCIQVFYPLFLYLALIKGINWKYLHFTHVKFIALRVRVNKCLATKINPFLLEAPE